MDMNDVKLSGIAIEDSTLSHTINNKCYYKFSLEVKRQSGIADTLNIFTTVSNNIEKGHFYKIQGIIKSRNLELNGHRSVELYVQAYNIQEIEEPLYENLVTIDGGICKPPISRTTLNNIHITDLCVSVNRSYAKSDYISVILWNKQAERARNYEVGDTIRIIGRLQSRTYTKKDKDGNELFTKTVYEISTFNHTHRINPKILEVPQE